jgi:hypothetical protein
MTRLLNALFRYEPGQLRQKIGGLYVLVIAVNLGAWTWTFHRR